MELHFDEPLFSTVSVAAFVEVVSNVGIGAAI